MNFDLNLWFWLLLAAVIAYVFALVGARLAARRRHDLLAAFASYNETVTMHLAGMVDNEEERLWRRLWTARATVEETEKAESQTRRDLEDVLASLQDAVLVVDGEARLRFLNASALKLFEVGIQDVLGANLIEALPSFGLDSAMRLALRDGQTSAQGVHLYSPRIREVFLRVAPVFSASGQTSGAVAIIQDLTELRRLERVRRDFVANASHELRTPIANIRATAETLLHAPEDADLIARFLPPLISEAERLSRLVSDLLDLARAEEGEHKPFAQVDLRSVVTNVLASLDEKSHRRGITITWEPPGATPPVLGDAAGLEQVVFNLVDNALSYTPGGGHVTLSLTPLLTADGSPPEVPANTVLEVSDTGIGIPEVDLPRVFERFYRVDKARSRSEGGTGLGLAIVKHIVETHGGHLEVRSKVGQGTTFSIELPTACG